MNRGFTVVEILITLVIMTILLTLGVITVRESLAQARDAERAEDVAILARGFENYYKRGNPYYIGPAITKGSYPGANNMIAMDGSGWCDSAYFKNASQAALYSVCKNYMLDALPGITVAALTPPEFNNPQLTNPWLSTGSDSPTQLINTFMSDRLNEGKYVYKPMTSTNLALCYDAGNCTRFVLLYKKETTGEIVEVWSKHN